MGLNTILMAIGATCGVRRVRCLLERSSARALVVARNTGSYGCNRVVTRLYPRLRGAGTKRPLRDGHLPFLHGTVAMNFGRGNYLA